MKDEMPELPPGYTLRPGVCGESMLFLLKDGLRCRRAPKGGLRGLPVWFRVGQELEAIPYAQAHYRLGLAPDQEVPKGA